MDRLQRKVATKVMKILNKFYPGAEEFEPAEHKIGSPEQYSRLAKQFSHQLRRQVKESYEAYHSTLEGIILTGDHEQFIRTEVESYFEGIPRLRKKHRNNNNKNANRMQEYDRRSDSSIFVSEIFYISQVCL